MDWTEFQPNSLDTIFSWAESQSWCRAMSSCPQDPEWHAEGDVWTHTKMVCSELIELEEWQSLGLEQQKILISAALFHDVAKPQTTRRDEITGRVTSPKHSIHGEKFCRQILRKLGCDLETREKISALVRYHGHPTFLADKAEPIHEVVRLSWLVDTRLLHLLSLADFRGRDTDSRDRTEENLYYLRLLAEEQGCFGSPFTFHNEHARFLFFRQVSPDLHYVPFENFDCQVIVLSGLPGSGKDTWISANASSWNHVSLDALREQMGVGPEENQGTVVQKAQETCRELLRAGDSFVFNATNLLRVTRQRWIELFISYNARVDIVYLEPPFENILRNNRQRSRTVPEAVILKLLEKCEPPTWAEAHGRKLVQRTAK